MWAREPLVLKNWCVVLDVGQQEGKKCREDDGRCAVWHVQRYVDASIIDSHRGGIGSKMIAAFCPHGTVRGVPGDRALCSNSKGLKYGCIYVISLTKRHGRFSCSSPK